MLPRFAIYLISIIAISSCSTNSAESTTTTDNEPHCSIQIQSIQSLMGSNYKLVGGLRACDDSGKITKELLLFAEGEPINNHKACNLFATTDTSIAWSVEQSPLRIAVSFYDRLPADSTILMQMNTVYDSIEVTYTVSGSTAI